MPLNIPLLLPRLFFLWGPCITTHGAFLHGPLTRRFLTLCLQCRPLSLGAFSFFSSYPKLISLIADFISVNLLEAFSFEEATRAGFSLSGTRQVTAVERSREHIV